MTKVNTNIKVGGETKVVFPPLHLSQQEVHDDPHRFKVLVAGRRFGKSWLALREALDAAINVGGNVWFISPTYNNVLIHWRNAKRMVGNLATYKNEQQKYMEFNFGDRHGALTFKSGDRPDNLLGEGLDFVVIDEAAYQSEELWYRVIRPALADRKGRALLISTPNGVSNYFYRLYLTGLDPYEPEWGAFRYPSINNPVITAAEVRAAKRDLPDLKFRQEFLAEFVSDAGGVFRGLENAAINPLLAVPVTGHSYIVGIDWGRKNDFTVLSIFDTIGDQVNIDRFGDIGFAVQRDRIKDAYEKWGFINMYVESNSMGMPNVEALQADGLPITPVFMTNVLKTSLVERLALNIERGSIRLLSKDTAIGEQQIGEMNSYSLHRTRGGLQITYDAPRGGHDDLVVGAMLANIGFNEPARVQLERAHNPFYGGKQPEPLGEINYYREQV